MWDIIRTICTYVMYLHSMCVTSLTFTQTLEGRWMKLRLSSRALPRDPQLEWQSPSPSFSDFKVNALSPCCCFFFHVLAQDRLRVSCETQTKKDKILRGLKNLSCGSSKWGMCVHTHGWHLSHGVNGESTTKCLQWHSMETNPELVYILWEQEAQGQ